MNDNNQLHRARPNGGKRDEKRVVPSNGTLHLARPSNTEMARNPVQRKVEKKRPVSRRPERIKTASRNREYAVITFIFVAMLFSVAVYFAYFMAFRSEDFIDSPYNSRLSQLSNTVLRGDILSADGKVLATTKTAEDGSETREYPYSNVYAHAIGYTVKGMSGVEQQSNFQLLRSHENILEKAKDSLLGGKYQGDDVVTTLDSRLQNVAYEGLGSYDGAVIALDPETGKILTMVSKPDYNPNTIASHWDSLTSDSNSSVLLNRTTQGLYPPGSTFKILTTLEYLDENQDDVSDFSYNCKGTFTNYGMTIHCSHNAVHGEENLIEAFGNSCNTAYANVGLSLDKTKYRKFVDSMLFNKDLPTQLKNVSKSQFNLDKDTDAAEVMQDAFGQGDTLVSPIHMAMIVSAIANDGELMEPYIIDHTQNAEGTTVKKTKDVSYGNLLSAGQTSEIQDYMRYVCTDGTASALNTSDYVTYGKTGTAEFNKARDTHAWFVGYAEKDGKKIAVAVLVEDSGTGSRYAVPIANQMFKTYFSE